MELAVYAHYFDSKRKWQRGAEEPESFEDDFIAVLEYIDSQKEINRKLDLKESKKVIYLKEYEYDSKQNAVLLHFISARYAKIRKVVNADTLLEQKAKKKGKRDGDEEHTYLIIKFKSQKDGVCLIANNTSGISLVKIVTYLDEFIEKYHKDKLKDKIRYKIITNNIVSKDFLKNLAKAKRIKGVKLTVDSKDVNVSDYKDFAEKSDLSEDIEIVLKPSGKGIFENTVKNFFNLYKKNTVRRIYVSGEDNNGEAVSFDTEKMKERIYLTIRETYTGEPEEADLKMELKKRIALY